MEDSGHLDSARNIALQPLFWTSLLAPVQISPAWTQCFGPPMECCLTTDFVAASMPGPHGENTNEKKHHLGGASFGEEKPTIATSSI